MKGTVEFNGYILQVTQIYFRNGGFFVIAEGKGPLPAYKGPCTIYGEDGLLVTTGGYIEVQESRKVTDQITLELTMKFLDPEATAL